jgi:hypothetical protein
MAASMSIFGGAELAARLPTLFASLIMIAGIYKLADTLYDKTTANLAVLILALSPMAILFAITLFTDTLLAALLCFSLLMAARQKWAGAGWAFGLAFACKQTALFFLPLIITVSALEWIHRRAHGERRQYEVNSAISALSAVKNFLLPFAFCVTAIFLWDYIRHAPISFWTQGYADNNRRLVSQRNLARLRRGASVHYGLGKRYCDRRPSVSSPLQSTFTPSRLRLHLCRLHHYLPRRLLAPRLQRMGSVLTCAHADCSIADGAVN